MICLYFSSLSPHVSHLTPFPLHMKNNLRRLERGDLKVGIQSKTFQEVYTLTNVVQTSLCLRIRTYPFCLPFPLDADRGAPVLQAYALVDGAEKINVCGHPLSNSDL